ncbi:MAG: sigma-E factor regulatory protein RseB domain-containing protein [Candidatus Tyrphobacter sp.]
MTLRGSAGLALAALACAAPAVSFAASHDEALALLHAAAEAPRHVSFVGEVEFLTIGAHGSQASVFRVDHSAPNRTRRWYVSPPNLYGDSNLSLGDATYTIDVRHRRVVITKNDWFGTHHGWHRNLQLLVRNYKAILGPTVEIVGRRARTIALVSRYTGTTTMRLWIDAKTNLMLQRQVYTSSGSLVVQMHFNEVHFTDAIPTSAFAMPVGYAVVSGPSRGVPSDDPSSVIAHAGFNARVPRYLPEGFVPVAADLAAEKGVRTLHILYSDGLRTVSLFENARGSDVDMSGFHPLPFVVGSVRGRSVDEGPMTLLAWSRAGLHFALVGDLNENELERIVASVSPR